VALNYLSRILLNFELLDRASRLKEKPAQCRPVTCVIRSWERARCADGADMPTWLGGMRVAPLAPLASDPKGAPAATLAICSDALAKGYQVRRAGPQPRRCDPPAG
jgi:hypothetical protein